MASALLPATRSSHGPCTCHSCQQLLCSRICTALPANQFRSSRQHSANARVHVFDVMINVFPYVI
eukprot:7721081-Prorocentrum_lima.AAC.1